MFDFGVSLDGAGSIEAWLRKGSDLGDKFERELGNWADDVLRDDLSGTANYASPPAGSTYVRTGEFGASWEVRKNRLSVEFVNRAAHAVHVVGDAAGTRQARIHAGRWWLMRKRIENRLPDAMQRMGKVVDKELG